MATRRLTCQFGLALLLLVSGCSSATDDQAAWTPTNTSASNGSSESALLVQVQAIGRLKRGDVEGAVSLLDRAVQGSPNDAQLILVRGTVLRRIGDYDRAIRDFDTTLSLDPTLADAYCQRAFARQQSEADARRSRPRLAGRRLDCARHSGPRGCRRVGLTRR